MHAIVRSRWAAIGAAIAVSLGAGGIGIGHAVVDTGDKPVVVTIDPCRLADLRPAPDTVGPRTTGLGPDETYTLDGWGDVGNCNLPSGITGLVLNVTAVGATAQTNLRFFPAGGSLPTAANLNPTPGAPPAPNAVTVGLNDSTGRFSIFNKFGNVAVIIDVVAYLDDHVHDDRYYTEAEVDAAIDAAAPAVVVSDGLFLDNFTFVPEKTFPVAEEVTTDRSGHLLVTKYFVGNTSCTPSAGAGRIYFLTIDGVGVPSSAIHAFNNDQQRVRLVGITDVPVDAGAHEIGVAAECSSSNTPGGSSTLVVSNTAVVVLPAG